MQIDEKIIEKIVQEVLKNIKVSESKKDEGPKASTLVSQDGIFSDYQAALKAAAEAQKKLALMGLDKREELVSSMRKAVVANAEKLARMAFEETKMGRYEHKIAKNINSALRTPGTEDLKTEAITGDDGLLLIERGPFGLTVAITPSTNPTATIINGSIGLIAAGNSVFFCPHPGAYKSSLETIRILNRAIREAGGPENLLVCPAEPDLEVVNKAMAHPDVKLIVATGGPGLVKAALSSGKRTVAAGPGNPPVLVDETADLAKAAKSIVAGASFDNNLPCISEKVIIAVDSIADELMRELEKNGGFRIQGSERIERLTATVFKDGRLNRGLVGRNASYILKEVGIDPGEDVMIAFFEAEEDHPLVQEEQLMPIIPVVRVKNFDEGVRLAVQVEHGFRHSAMIHTKDMDRATRFARAIETTVFVINGPSSAGLGDGGEGHITFTVAGPTGEGVTSARRFTRERRLVVCGTLSIK
jgi:propionaldehyde dehydrogenase